MIRYFRKYDDNLKEVNDFKRETLVTEILECWTIKNRKNFYKNYTFGLLIFTLLVF